MITQTVNNLRDNGFSLGFSILIVDDEEAIRELCAAILRGYGHACETAGSGPEGIQKFSAANGTFDLILSDVLMPDISGPEMVRRMQIMRPDLRAIYMSGFPDASFPPSRKKPLFIQKPFTSERLVAAIERAMSA